MSGVKAISVLFRRKSAACQHQVTHWQAKLFKVRQGRPLKVSFFQPPTGIGNFWTTSRPTDSQHINFEETLSICQPRSLDISNTRVELWTLPTAKVFSHVCLLKISQRKKLRKEQRREERTKRKCGQALTLSAMFRYIPFKLSLPEVLNGRAFDRIDRNENQTLGMQDSKFKSSDH